MEAIRSIPDIMPDESNSLGIQVFAWMLEYLQHPEKAKGTPWVLTKEQLRILGRWYQVNEAGQFAYRRGVVRRMKGWGKDPFLASIACAELCGPVLPAGRDARGRLVGKPWDASWIQIAAVSKTQTRNTMLLMPGMISDRMIADYNIDVGKEIIYAARGKSQIQAVTSSARALEGSRTTFFVMNETHHWLEGNEGIAMAEVGRRNTSKVGGRSMEITNAHLPDEGSVGEMTYEGWRQNPTGLYYDSLESSPVEDLSPDNRQAIVEAITIARGDSTWVNPERLADEILDPATPDGMARRFYLNQITKLGGTWLPDGMWDAVRSSKKIPPHTRVVLALDGSYNGDSTALVMASIEDVPHLQVVGCWEAPVEQPYWKVNIADVEEAIRNACVTYDVLEVVADPYRWARSLEALAAEGLPVLEFPQSPSRMTPATAKMYEAVINGTVTQDGDQRLGRHIQNAVLKVDSRGQRLQKENKGSPKKIDLAVTAVMAFDRATNIFTDIGEAERCETCGAPLNSRGACDVCPPQVFSIRELVQTMRGGN